MANPKLLACDLSTFTFSSASGTDASFPLTNLQDYYPDTYWKSNDGSNIPQHLAIDLGTAQDCNMMVIAGHNLSNITDGNTIIQGADNAAFSSGLTSLATYSVGTTMADPVAITWPNLVSKRYWRILIGSGATVISAAPRIGSVLVGAAVEFTTPYEFGYKRDNAQYETYETPALDGRIRTSQVFNGRYVWELAFKLQNNTLASNFKSFMATTRGKLRPFYIIDSDGTIRCMQLLDDYVPVTTTRYNKNDVSLRMKEVLATR